MIVFSKNALIIQYMQKMSKYRIRGIKVFDTTGL